MELNMHPWLFLTLAGIAEIAWVIGLKYSAGFTRLTPSVLTISAMVFSMVTLGLATKTLPIGTAYAVCTGIGAAGAAIAGIILFAESASLPRLLCIGLIVAGVVGLKLSTPG